MLETPHSLLGGALGGLTGNPLAAGPLGVASHFAGDRLPHWNPAYPFRPRAMLFFVIADFLVALALVPAFWVLFPDRPEIAIGAFGGCLPDIMLAINLLFKRHWLPAVERFHVAVQCEVPFRQGWWPQAGVATLSLLYLIRP